MIEIAVAWSTILKPMANITSGSTRPCSWNATLQTSVLFVCLYKYVFEWMIQLLQRYIWNIYDLFMNLKSTSVPIELIQITFSHTLFKTRVLTDKNFDMKYIWTNVYVNGVHLTVFWRTGHTSGKCCVKPNCWQSMNILDHWSMTIYWFPLLKVPSFCKLIGNIIAEIFSNLWQI